MFPNSFPFIKAFLLLALLLAAIPVPAAAAREAPFDWTMAERLGPSDEDGLVGYANSAAEFEEEEAERKGFEVELAVRRTLCRNHLAYTWSSSAGTIAKGGKPGCRVTQSFSSEGEHLVRLTVRYPGGRERRFDRTVTVQDWLVVSIGDSVASGEGNPDQPGRNLPGKRFRARWQSPRCHRSAKAAPAQAALALEASEPRTSTTFVHLACSGAKIGEGLLGRYTGIDVDKFTEPLRLPPQVRELEQIARERRVDAVLLSIGANDIHFGPIVEFCLRKRTCMKKQFQPKREPGSPPVKGGELAAVAAEALARLPDAYDELAGRLRKVVAPQRVVAVEYFDPIHDSEGEPCPRIGLPNRLGWKQIDRNEAEWAASELLEPLNATLGEAVERAGWTEVDGVAATFRTHGYCADDTWVVRILESLKKQKGLRLKSRVSGGFHPNEKGHLEEGKMIGPVLRDVLDGDPLADIRDDPPVVTVERREAPGDDGEEGVERTGGIVLGGTAMVLAAGAGLAMRRRPRRDGGDLWEHEWEADDLLPLPSPPREEPDREGAMEFGALVENQAEWVHRRVESIELVDERIVRRRVSIDFDPGELGELPRSPLAPIALLAKQVLTRFDLRDEEGRSVPLASSEQNAAYAAKYMLVLAEKATGQPPSARLEQLCWQVARGEPDVAWAAVEEMADRLEPVETREALRESDRFRAAATTFADNFAVMVEVDHPPRRRVLKLAYDQVMNTKLALRTRLGLDPASIEISLPELGDARSRHIEFVRAEGLEFWSDSLRVELPDGRTVRPRSERTTGDAHLAVSGMRRETRGVAEVLLRAIRSGILVWGPGLAFLAAVALTGAWFALPDLAGDSAGGAASILIAVPAAFGAYLSARPSHPMESALLLGARVLVFATGALAFLGATTLALNPSLTTLRILLGVIALLSWCAFAGLVVIYLSPRPRPSVDRPPLP